MKALARRLQHSRPLGGRVAGPGLWRPRGERERPSERRAEGERGRAGRSTAGRGRHVLAPEPPAAAMVPPDARAAAGGGGGSPDRSPQEAPGPNLNPAFRSPGARDLQEGAGRTVLTDREAPKRQILPRTVPPALVAAAGRGVRKDVRAPCLCLRRFDVTPASHPHPPAVQSHAQHPRAGARRPGWAGPRGAGRRGGAPRGGTPGRDLRGGAVGDEQTGRQVVGWIGE